MDSIVGTLSQLGKRLRVLTYLGLHEEDRPGDPFLLTSVKGSEDISKPFSFQLDMHRDPNRPYILPSRLVNTPVHFGIRIRSKPYGNEKYPRYIYRTGIVESAEVKFLSQTVKSNVWKYSIDVVPTFKLLEREIVFRVFENMDVRQILKEILADNSYPYLYVDFKGIEAEPFPVLPYCVQFGESTLNFASRLMAQFGIWYYFHNGQIRMGPEPPDLRNGRMVLGKSTPPAEACALPDLKVENLKEEGEIDDEETVAHLMQAVHPTAQWIRSASFNPLQPTSPISSSAKIAPVLNVLSEPGSLPAEDSSHYRSELFGTPASNNGHAGVLAQARMSGAEACVWTLPGCRTDLQYIERRQRWPSQATLGQSPRNRCIRVWLRVQCSHQYLVGVPQPGAPAHEHLRRGPARVQRRGAESQQLAAEPISLRYADAVAQ